MDILIWIALGLVAGILATLFVGFVGRVAGVYDAGERAGWIAATLGAAAILVVYNILRRR